MQPYEIAACVKKMFTEHPEKHRTGWYFKDGGFCVLGAAILCVSPDFNPLVNKVIDGIINPVLKFNIAFQNLTPNMESAGYINDNYGLPGIFLVLDRMIEEGLKHEAHKSL